MDNQVALFNVLVAITGVLIPIALYILWNKSKDKVSVLTKVRKSNVGLMLSTVCVAEPTLNQHY